MRARPPAQRVNYAALGRAGCVAAASPLGCDWGLLWPGRARRGAYLDDVASFGALGCGCRGGEAGGGGGGDRPFVCRVLRDPVAVAAVLSGGGGGGASDAVHDLLRVCVLVWRGGALEPHSALVAPAASDAAAWGRDGEWPGVESRDCDSRAVVGYITSAHEASAVGFVRADAARALVASAAAMRVRWRGRGPTDAAAAGGSAAAWARVLVQGPRACWLRPAELCVYTA